ncbi:hypothetical protein QM012_002739 [Aureobasidium pullulans]|uniref:Rhodopsin domain-containing protein n=1 Tax=Aureobasidium pullulans TaxID=5580 RepID=A0ABR0TAF2_AURPU
MARWGGRDGTTQVVIVFVFLVLAFIILSLRLFTRFIVTRNHGPEDWVITAAFCFSITQAVLVLIEVQNGQGLPQSMLSEDNILDLRKTLYVTIPTYLAGLTLTKLSILLQYMRLFREKTIHRIIIGMLVFVAAFGTWSILASLLLCRPVHYFWDGIGNGKCLNFKAKWFSDAAYNIITDLILLSIPMPFIKGLNLPYRQKAGLIAVFALGGFVCLVSIARLGPLYVIASDADVSRHNGPAAFLSSMEVNVGIICASLPSLRAITLRTCSRRNTNHQSTSQHHSHSGWWRFGRKNDNIELEAGPKQDMSHTGSAITKIISVNQERKDARKVSIWSLDGGGIFAGAGISKAHIQSNAK